MTSLLRSLRRGTHLNQPDRDLHSTLLVGSSGHDGTHGSELHREWCSYILAECICSIVRFEEEGAFSQLRPYEQQNRP